MKSGERELSDRKKQILKAIVDMHIANGEPIGSKSLMQTTHMSVSPATIRNEMADLEELGYLEQPHASSGRVPSKKGYEFYVDSLMQRYLMTENEIDDLNSMLDKKRAELGGIIEAASRLIGTMTNYTSLAVKPRNHGIFISRFDALYLSKHDFVLVCIMSFGESRSKRIYTKLDINEEVLSEFSKLLNSMLSGFGIAQISLPVIMELKSKMGDYAELVDDVLSHIYSLYEEFDLGELHIDGVDRVLQYPEYQSRENLKEVFGVFEKKDDILNLVASADPDKVNIFIGNGNDKSPSLGSSSLVLRTVKRGDEVIGAIGVLGPCRMNYSKVTAFIDCMSEKISDMLTERMLPEFGDKK
ncbi:MAG: heat-inducible transcription repressor HrcA [Clostridia bacterium]|nr:heat-inducible transcription repressor HrcA [Clostridia bacterium]